VSAPIVLPPLGDPVDELWEVLIELGQHLDVPWTLIGGQMVLLHAVEHGTVPPQLSQDGDVVADIRAAPGGLHEVVALLGQLGFDLEGIGTDGTAHRYARPGRIRGRPVVIDVLAPDGVGPRADLTTTHPGHTVQVPGGTQALGRTERVAVQVSGRIGMIPRPNLLGAVVAKAGACGLPGDPARHLRDLALLCALIDDPFDFIDELTAADRKRLKLAGALNDRTHPAWILVPGPLRDDGRAAWAILNNLPLTGASVH
jgi:hypothetical protein